MAWTKAVAMKWYAGYILKVEPAELADEWDMVFIFKENNQRWLREFQPKQL